MRGTRKPAGTTRLFPGAIKPARPGVYGRKVPHVDSIVYSKWTGTKWMLNAYTKKRAALYDALRFESYYQALPWFGLTYHEYRRRGGK